MEKQEKSQPEENAPGAKRARTNEPVKSKDDGLPLVLQLGIPYIPVGDLWALAACNRACRAAALGSYHKRLESPFPIRRSLISEKEDEQLVPTMKPLLIEGTENVPLCYREGNPWSHLDFRKHNRRLGCISTVRLNSDKVEWRTGSTSLEWQEGILYRPDELPNTSQCYVVHYDLRGMSLFVIITKFCSLSGQQLDEYDEDDEDTAKELWGLLYDMDPNQKDSDGRFRPLLVQKLLDEPKGIEWSVDYEPVSFGHACRSGNGKVVAAVTALPNSEYNDGQPAEVTLFDVAGNGFVQRSTLSVSTFNTVCDYSDIKLSMSTGGEILSIFNEEKYDEEGGLAVYDIRDASCPVIIWEVKGFATGEKLVYFTPDNEFVMHFPSTTRGGVNEIKTKDFPRFAGRVVCHT